MTEPTTHTHQTSDIIPKGVSIADYLAQPEMTYEAAAKLGYEGTAENWEAFKTEYLARIPKEGYIERMSDEKIAELAAPKVVPVGEADYSSASAVIDVKLSPEDMAELVPAIKLTEEGFVDVPALWEGTAKPSGLPAIDAALRPLMINASGDVNILRMEQLYPLRHDVAYADDHIARINALLKFCNLIVQDSEVEPVIYTYLGMAEAQEIRWIRFQIGAEQSFSFALLEKNYSYFIETLDHEFPLEWALQGNESPALNTKGLYLNVSRAPIELPLHFFLAPFAPSEGDELFNGDWIQLEQTMARLRIKISTKLRDITQKANVLVNADIEKDHDLYLVFKATNNFTALNVTLDKVYPKLPESGEVSLGDNPTTVFEWNGKDKKVLIAVKQINTGCKHINKEIGIARNLISQHPLVQKEFDALLKVELYAAAHFTNRIYNFAPEFGINLISEVTNDILRALTEYSKTEWPDGRTERTIGLDLNSWIVWEYLPGVPPTRATAESVDFVNNLFNRYTESFIGALYEKLINLGNPLIRPYDFREVADLSDGIPLGSIRRVK